MVDRPVTGAEDMLDDALGVTVTPETTDELLDRAEVHAANHSESASVLSDLCVTVRAWRDMALRTLRGVVE